MLFEKKIEKRESEKNKDAKDAVLVRLPTLSELIVDNKLEIEAAFHFLRNYLALIYVRVSIEIAFAFYAHVQTDVDFLAAPTTPLLCEPPIRTLSLVEDVASVKPNLRVVR